MGHAVVDYVIGNSATLNHAQSLTVQPWRKDWSDHSELVIVMSVEHQTQESNMDHSTRGTRTRRRRVKLPEGSELDKLLLKAWESRSRPDEELIALYGAAYCLTDEIQVYVDGSCFDNGGREAQAGAGVYFGTGNRKNLAVRTPDSQTNNRGEVYAILRALLASNRHKSLVINSDSEYAINMLTTWGPAKAALGWKVTNGDILSDIAWLLKSRPASVLFRKVKAHSGNAHNDAADALAKEGAQAPPAPPYERLDRQALDRSRCQCDACRERKPAMRADKVMVELGERRAASRRYRETEVDLEDSLTLAKRKSRERQAELRLELYETTGERAFWQYLKRLKGSKPGSCSDITAQVLMEVFKERMNFLVPIPDIYDAPRLTLNRAVIRTLPARTPDVSPLQSFSRPFTEEEIETVKGKLKARMGSAKGRDGISYHDIFIMDNECLLELCNRCIELCDSPTTWIETRLVGLCKKGKPKDAPGSYRTIGLESCLLKFMTMLVHERLVEWAVNRGLIPPSQNGFRQGHRTNDNVFVRYVVHISHEGSESERFKADMGILIGDTCSPILWALYMADLPRFIARDEGDVQLGNVEITSLEQADDVVLLATSPEALQRKLDGMLRWCQVNFMTINSTKSVVMVFGRRPRGHTAQFSFGHGQPQLAVVDTQLYLGFTISSKRPGLLREHYNDKREKALRVGRGVCGVEQLVGTLPPALSIKLYMALVDPHLIHGCDVMPDVNGTALALLTDVQKAFLRRALGLSKRSIISVLFTETGLDPLEFRRLDLVVGYWQYMVTCGPSRYVYQAMREAIQLDFDGHKSWISDLRVALAREADEIVFPAHSDLMKDDVATGVRESLKAALGARLKMRTNNARRLYLLHNRLEPAEEGKEWQVVPSQLRHYLRVAMVTRR
ncbi:hypothetical protein EST38_g13290 [Candolleomyces aberdarensis]|uniref:RNase H type-1 domain-containing protein n=1 Tax=Candolleomyces aberdarensis TaxID=2316362 RepID=A0A4Q2D0A6_9AGAR|nr:hypothetical protein EST38_g13290 [Candolleomyces aberdarensis]